MMRKKGMSAIVSTLILVLLVLIATGLLWKPVKNLLDDSQKSFDTTRCFDLDFRVKFTRLASDFDSYRVEITRRSDSNNEAVYMKMVFNNGTDYSGIYEATNSWDPLSTYVEQVNDQEVENATTLELTPYFVDDFDGTKIYCKTMEIGIV
jgi:hypothetical protein